MQIREFYCTGREVGRQKVEVHVGEEYRIVKNIQSAGADRYYITCWNGDQFRVEGYADIRVKGEHKDYGTGISWKGWPARSK